MPSSHRGEVEVWVVLLNLGTGGEWVVSAPPRPLYPLEENRYSLYRMLGGPGDRCGWVLKISPRSGFDPHALQHVE
jgi:hypothetical protein